MKDKKIQTEEQRRGRRRKRREREQLAAYATLFTFVILAAVGIVFAVRWITQSIPRAEQQENMSKVEELLATEETLEIEETEAAAPELTETERLDEIVNAAIEVMPLEDKVAGLFIVTPEALTGVSKATEAGQGTRDALALHAVGGLIYGSRNIKSAEQFAALIGNTKEYSKYPLFMAIREEGGSISSLSEAGIMEPVEGAAAIGAGGNPDAAYQAGAAIGSAMKALGLNLNLAPVADIANVESSIIKERAYGADALTVSSYVKAMVQGLKESGAASCLIHFPGIGIATEDQDAGLVSLDRSTEQFQAEEFTVFTAGMDAGADMVMVSHVAAPALTGDSVPCSMSKKVVTDVIRGQMGFNGIIISDAMDVAAISQYYGADDAAIMALRAGCDMILTPENFETAYKGVLQAVGEGMISEERINDSLRRIYRVKYADQVSEE